MMKRMDVKKWGKSVEDVGCVDGLQKWYDMSWITYTMTHIIRLIDQ